jgi:hypothetical protein
MQNQFKRLKIILQVAQVARAQAKACILHTMPYEFRNLCWGIFFNKFVTPNESIFSLISNILIH